MTKLGIIGTGRIAGRFALTVEKEQEAEIVCVYNPHPESAKRFAEDNNIELHTDNIEDMLDKVDAVYIATPHETHYKYAKICLQAGKHVLCEKPIALAQREAEELFQLAESQKCVLMEAVKTAYCEGFQKMMEVARSGRIGTIHDVEACFSRLTPSTMREYTDAEAGGSLTEFGTYTFLPIVKLLGSDYKNVTFQSMQAENGIDTYTKTSLEYENAFAMAKTGLAVKSEGQLVIAGTKGYILAQSPWWLTGHFEVHYEDSSKVEEYNFKFEPTGLQYELAAFLKAIYGDYQKERLEQIYHTGMAPEDSIAITGIIEAFLAKRIQQSAKNSSECLQKKNRQDIKIWAHRGCSMEYPENTLEAFEAAAKLPGITGIELDVQLTKDRQVVVFHDENVARVTDGDKNVRDYTLEELQQLRVAPGRERETTIPTLEEVLELLAPYCRKNNLHINIELKTSIIRYEGIEELTLELVRKYQLEQYIVYSSFLPDSITHIKELDTSAKTGILNVELEQCIHHAEWTQADALHSWIGSLTCRIPEAYKKLPVRVWGLGEPFYTDEGTLRKLISLHDYQALGVTDVITNVPEKYLENYKES